MRLANHRMLTVTSAPEGSRFEGVEANSEACSGEGVLPVSNQVLLRDYTQDLQSFICFTGQESLVRFYEKSCDGGGEKTGLYVHGCQIDDIQIGSRLTKVISVSISSLHSLILSSSYFLMSSAIAAHPVG